MKSAKDIEVHDFRHIVIWPVLLRGHPTSEAGEEGILQPWVDELTATNWQEEQSSVGHGIHSRFSYEQIVYFHPFVRDFLFGDGTDDYQNRATRILTRNDVRGLQVEVGKCQPPGIRLRFDVARTELYLCKPCVAILVIEVIQPQRTDGVAVSLDVLQDFTDQFRRLYPPFWWSVPKSADDKQQSNPSEAGLCLRNLAWLDEAGNTIDITAHTADPQAKQRQLQSAKTAFEAFTRQGAEPPLFAHWQWFFGKSIRPAQLKRHIHPPIDVDPTELYVQQLLDERMPVMSYYAVEQPDEVSTGDHDRLTFVDASGSDAFPYQEQFLADRRARYSYERFAHYGARYFCSGYGFAMIGPSDDFFYRQILPDHFSHHYFCLGLIAHYQRAALLYFADELARSVKDLAGKPIAQELSSPEYLSYVEEIQHRFLKFRTRAYFPEVTNQLQGRELFEMWFDVLETQRLFELVDSASERLTSVLSERESRQLARVASAAIPWLIGLATAAAMFTAIDSLRMRNWFNPPDWDFWLVVVFSVLMASTAHYFLKQVRYEPWWRWPCALVKRLWTSTVRRRT